MDADGRVRDLRSCIGVYPTLKVGEELQLTRDLASAPGAFLLIHAREDVVHGDEALVRQMEATDLFETVPTIADLPATTPVDKVTDADILKSGRTSGLGRASAHRVSPFMVSPRQQFCRNVEHDAFDPEVHELELNFEDAADHTNDAKVLGAREHPARSRTSTQSQADSLASPAKQKISITSSGFADSPTLLGS